MKDAYLSPMAQAFVCMLASVGVLILSTRFPAIADELKVAAGAIGTLWFRFPQKAKASPDEPSIPPVAPLLCLVLALAANACAVAPKHVKTVDAAAQGVEEFGQKLMGLYQLQLGACALQATSEMSYTICRISLEETWGPVKDKYAALRRTLEAFQGDVADGRLSADDFAKWSAMAYCELREAAPPELILLPVPGLCEVSQ